MKNKYIKILGLTVCLAVLSNSAFAAYTVFDPKNYAENLAAKVQAIKQVEQQAQQLQNELANLKKLDPSNQAQTIQRIQDTISTMERLRKTTDAIGTDFTDLMKEWDAARPDYTTWNGASAEEYGDQIKAFRDIWDKALEQSMKSQTMASPTEQAKTAESLEQLLSASQNADGIVGVTQAMSQMIALQIAESQKMQAVMADSIRSQNIYQQRMIEGEKQAVQRNKEFMDGEKYESSELVDNGNPHHFGSN